MKTVLHIFLWLIRLCLFVICVACEYMLSLLLEIIRALKGTIHFK